MNDLDREKKIAAEAAAQLVDDGMTVGLGTGSTVAHLLPALAARSLRIRCVATSPATESVGRDLGLAVEPFDSLGHLDIAIDGTDQIAPDGWLVKGGGGAHLREKIVAAAARRFVVIGDSSKVADALHAPLPIELREFGLAATLESLEALGTVAIRDWPRSPDNGIIADLTCDLADPAGVARALEANPGVAAHGLFDRGLVSEALIGRGVEVSEVFSRR